MERCAYCGEKKRCRFEAKGPSGETLPCCSEGCREQAQLFAKKVRHGRPLFYLGLTLGILLLLIGLGVQSVTGSILLQQLLMGVSFLLIGAALLAFPYAPPDAVASAGIRRTLRIMRIIGVLLTLLGAAIIAIKLIFR